MDQPDLGKLFNPASIAMIGVSAEGGKWGHIILLNILKGNYQGTVYPVNPREEAILGYKCYPTVRAIPDKVDLALIVTPAQVVPSLMDECGAKGIPFVVVITSDFSETGSEGAELEREVVARARKHGIRVVGPNSMGIFCSTSNLHAQMPPLMPLQGSVSMLSQSGNLGVQILGWGEQQGVGFEKFVSSGNEGDLNCVDFLRYFGQDEDTRVILAYLEGIDPGTPLVEEAQAISRKKPIIVFKGGRTAAGGRAAASHSGALAGADRIFKGAVEQAGMLGVTTSQALLDCAKAFANYPLPKGNRVGIITRGGGWGVITADCCDENGLVVPPLSAALIQRLDEFLPPYWSRGNPVDLVATIAYDPYPECLEILADWEGVDAVLALGVGSLLPSYPFSHEVKGPPQLLEAIHRASQDFERQIQNSDNILHGIGRLVKRAGKPIIAVGLGSEASHKTNLEEFQVVSFPTPERAVHVLRQMYKYRRFLDLRAS
ncbi:MAG: CoA-binding protein [Desulfobacterales bacterium]|nr:MAG: CoA-binding protein [Desulfobacterales bacterium]